MGGARAATHVQSLVSLPGCAFSTASDDAACPIGFAVESGAQSRCLCCHARGVTVDSRAGARFLCWLADSDRWCESFRMFYGTLASYYSRVFVRASRVCMCVYFHVSVDFKSQ